MDRSYFTPKMNELVELAGISEHAVELLIRNRGGCRIRIPRQLRPDHWLCGLIGAKNATLLSDYYGGEDIDLPLGPFSSSAERHQAIRRLDREGLSYNEIAKRTGVNRRTAIRHVKGTSNRSQQEQPDMFAGHHPRPKRK
ncbi:helix-turn-helix domain-containing protein [Polycladidibacter hongkongensis]|uniref:helix-turn-helix domain-containing protein n=1 Tax=Polycladidibacter hongkongensis TaxID=1647556 RepID=UPI00082C94D9|nr:helix-turn-helix domain-containing protein [Pseudovibrio hongkongensis]